MTAHWRSESVSKNTSKLKYKDFENSLVSDLVFVDKLGQKRKLISMLIYTFATLDSHIVVAKDEN